MKYKECIKIVGIKTVILYEFFYILEIIINLPYLILRGVAIILSNFLEIFIIIFEKLQEFLAYIFDKNRIINLSKLNKKIDSFRINTIKTLLKYNKRNKWRRVNN